jgi:hypothetical protein
MNWVEYLKLPWIIEPEDVNIRACKEAVDLSKKPNRQYEVRKKTITTYQDNDEMYTMKNLTVYNTDWFLLLNNTFDCRSYVNNMGRCSCAESRQGYVMRRCWPIWRHSPKERETDRETTKNSITVVSNPVEIRTWYLQSAAVRSISSYCYVYSIKKWLDM